mgnify:CR=1 FL=1
MAENQEQIDNDALDQVEADSWANIEKDFLADKGVPEKKEESEEDKDKKTELSDEEKAQKEKDDKLTADAAAAEKAEKLANETEEEKTAREAKEAEDAAAENDKPNETDRTVRDQRAIQREIEADRKQTLEEVRAKVMKDVPQRLEDSDGEEIRTIEDVMQLKNKKTGKAFTEEEAGAWLLAATKWLNDQRDSKEAEVERLADLQLTIKDEAQSVREKYGELFKNVPGLQQQVWGKYKEKFLVVDNDLEMVTELKMGLEEFYDLQLAPYLAQAEKIASEESEAAKEKKVEKKVEKERKRADRSDVFGGKSDLGKDKEEDDWARVAKEYYEG